MSWDKLYTGRNYALYHNTGEITVYYKYSTVKGVIHKSHGKPTKKLRVSTVNYISRKPTTKLRVSTRTTSNAHTLSKTSPETTSIFSLCTWVPLLMHDTNHLIMKKRTFLSVIVNYWICLKRPWQARKKSVWQNF